MQKYDTVPFPEVPVVNQVDQPGQRFAAVNRVEQQTLEPREQHDCPGAKPAVFVFDPMVPPQKSKTRAYARVQVYTVLEDGFRDTTSHPGILGVKPGYEGPYVEPLSLFDVDPDRLLPGFDGLGNPHLEHAVTRLRGDPGLVGIRR